MGRIYGPYHYSSNKKPYYRWQVTKFADSLCVLELLRPHLSAPKLEQIDRVIAEVG